MWLPCFHPNSKGQEQVLQQSLQLEMRIWGGTLGRKEYKWKAWPLVSGDRGRARCRWSSWPKWKYGQWRQCGGSGWWEAIIGDVRDEDSSLVKPIIQPGIFTIHMWQGFMNQTIPKPSKFCKLKNQDWALLTNRWMILNFWKQQTTLWD